MYKKAIIALAGPITNLALAVLVIIFASISTNIQNTYIYQILIYSNFLIAMFNLIPIYPMDGGRFLNEVLKLILEIKLHIKLHILFQKQF